MRNLHIGVLGINHKQADLKLREVVATAYQRYFSLGNPFQNSTSFVLLSTCNRSELYFSSFNLAHTHSHIFELLRKEIPHDFEQKCYSFFGRDCFHHLAKVTAGLDSAILAETEIQGQVKTAYEHARRLQPLASELHFLFQKCLKIGKDIRTTLLLPTQLPDIEHAILQIANNFFKNKGIPRLLLVGASHINAKIAALIAKKNVAAITVANRSLLPGIELAQALKGETLAWKEISTCWHTFDWIMTATKCPYHIISGTPQQEKLLIDLAVPRNMCPRIAGAGSMLYNIDALHTLLDERKYAVGRCLEHAEAVIAKAVMHYYPELALQAQDSI